MKKTLSILLTLALAVIAAAGMTVFAAAEMETQPTGIIYGDANTDGAVNMKDVLTIRKYVADLPVEIDLIAADTNGDSAVNMKDVLTVRKFVAGLIDVIEGGEIEPTETGVEPTGTDVEPTQTVATEPTAAPTTKPTTKPTTAPTEPARETVVFGSYEQDGNLDNGAEPIEWIVLEEKDGAKLLLSRYVLDYRMQADHYCENYQWGIGEDVRNWLNNKFYDEAFSDDEKSLLRDRCILTESAFLDGEDMPTYDRVSLLSKEELGQYFDLKTDAQNNIYSESVLAEATPYAAANFEFTTTVDANWYGFKHLGYSDEWMGKNTALWLLRAPGGGGSCDASFVSDSGIVCYDYLTTFLGGVRPVILLADEPYTFDETACYPENAKMVKMVQRDRKGIAYQWEEYTYDKNGNQTSYRYFFNGCVEWFSAWDAAYDENGNRTSERYYYADGSVDYWHEYTYDANGNQTSERYHYNGISYLHMTVVYDKNGNCINTRYYDEDGSVDWAYLNRKGGDGSVGLGATADATYDENGNRLSETRYKADGSVSYCTKYTYDANGNCIKARCYDENNNFIWCYYDKEEQWYLGFSWDATYDANGNTLTKTYYKEEGNVNWEYSYKCTYDANGNRTSYRSYNADGSVDWECSYDCTYDANGNQTSERSYKEDGSSYVSWEYTYDANGNQTSYRSYYEDGSVDWWWSWDATYDANGNQTSYRSYCEEDCVCVWLEYTYDENGNQTSERSYKEDGSVEFWSESIYENGVLVKDLIYEYYEFLQDAEAETIYLYDKNGNLISRKTTLLNSDEIFDSPKSWALGWVTYEYES